MSRPGGKYAEKKVGVTQAEALPAGNELVEARMKKAAKVLVESQPVYIYSQQPLHHFDLYEFNLLMTIVPDMIITYFLYTNGSIRKQSKSNDLK